MDDAEAMQMLKTIGNLVKDVRQVSFSALCQLEIRRRFVDNVS